MDAYIYPGDPATPASRSAMLGPQIAAGAEADAAVAGDVFMAPVPVEDSQITVVEPTQVVEPTPSLARAHAATRLDSIEEDLDAVFDSLPPEPAGIDEASALPAMPRAASTLTHAPSFEDTSLPARVIQARSSTNNEVDKPKILPMIQVFPDSNRGLTPKSCL